jgi:hypothetical protein
MSEVHSAQVAGNAGHHCEGGTPVRGLAEWLCLAATPTFAIMALLASLRGSSMDMLCLSSHGAALSGMVPMYLLMSAFHLPCWLNLIRGAHSRVPRQGNASGQRLLGGHGH